MCALNGRARELEISRSFGAQRIVSEFQTLDRIICTAVLCSCLDLDFHCAKGAHSRNFGMLEKLDILKRLNLFVEMKFLCCSETHS